jgi:beta-phosphoglucomutase-like phosphatase (HAD superfamily)
MEHIYNMYDLFIFDLDDTLVKTEKYHYIAWIKTLKTVIDIDFDLSQDMFFSIFHSIKPNNIQNYLKNELFINNVEDVIKMKNKIYFDLINNDKHNLKLLDGCEEFIKQILFHNKKFVIVSNSLKEHIDFFSDVFPILKKSSKNYYREILIKRKPDSECYLKVVDDFPNMTMVGFEDSITGIQSITGVPCIYTYFINTSDYYHYNDIIANYNVTHIINYIDFL